MNTTIIRTVQVNIKCRRSVPLYNDVRLSKIRFWGFVGDNKKGYSIFIGRLIGRFGMF